MKSVAVLVLMALPVLQAAKVNPIEKVLSMISGLQQKVVAEGQKVQKIYDETAEFCSDRAQQLGFELKTGKAEIGELKSTIESATATITSLGSKVEELSSDISSNENDVKAATAIRKKENADFTANEAELTEVVDSLERAVSILSKEAAKGGASMLQLQSANSVAQAFTVMVQAAAMSSADASKLTALVQQRTQQSSDEEDTDSDSETGAPAAAVYKGQSGGIVSVLEGLLEKAQSQLDSERKQESTARQNYEMLKQSLSDEIRFASKDMDEAKANMAGSQEGKSVAEGDLSATSTDYAGDKNAKEELHHQCMTSAQEFEAGVKSRGDELSALAQAKKVIQDATGGATGQTYDLNQVSFVQVAAKIRSSADLAGYEAVRFVRNLGNHQHSASLVQLASRMDSAMHMGSSAGGDVFAKVKGLINDMLATLEAEAESEASHKAYCDKEMSETASKKDDKTSDVEGLSTKIAQKKAMSTKLQEQVATLQNELASSTKSQAEASQLRQKENDDYTANKAELEQGIKGVQTALKVLRDYYAQDSGAAEHQSSGGAGASIIGLLEVCESDFSKGLAEVVAEEETAAASYEEETKANEIETASKGKDVEYKTKEFKGLDKAVSDLSNDLSSVQTELDAILEYSGKINAECISKPEPYAERKKRREAELAGLKEALTILEGETSLLQKTTKHTLRGARRA